MRTWQTAEKEFKGIVLALGEESRMTRKGGGEGSDVHSGSFSFQGTRHLSFVTDHLPETAQIHCYFCTTCIVR